MSSLPIMPAPAEVELLSFAVDAHGIVIYMRTKRPAVPCPECGERSDRVHSRYTRTLKDLPWHGTAVQLRIQTRRFFCTTARCERRIFAERLPGTAAAYGRRTFRFASALRAIALALGGEAGARLSRELGVGTSADTLLRRIRSSTGPPSTPPSLRGVGVDEWAYRKGRNYGTIVVDLERSRVVDLLPDRSADSFAAWLKDHPGVEVISRDRSGTYGEGARRGAPKAVQVADRWHLVKNLTDAVERALEGKSALLKQAATAASRSTSVEASPPPETTPTAPRPPTRAQRAKAARRERRLERYREVVALHGRGVSKRAIARQVGLSRPTVHRWLEAGSFPERKERAPNPSKLDPYMPYLAHRLREGCTNASQLYREIRTRGYDGGFSLVRDRVRQMKKEGGLRPSSPTTPRPSMRRTAWLLVLPAEDLTPEHRAYVEALTRISCEIRVVRELASEFRRILRDHDLRSFGAWVEAARQSLLRSFANSIHADAAAVRGAITLPWSNGPVEGHVNRLKMLKRQMYGRAGFDLLRERVLHAA